MHCALLVALQSCRVCFCGRWPGPEVGLFCAICTINQAGPGNICWPGNWSRDAVLNIEARPSHLPDNSRKPTKVLDGGGGWGGAKQQHGSIVSPFAVSKSNCPLRPWCGNLLCWEFYSMCVQLIKSSSWSSSHKNTHCEPGLMIITHYNIGWDDVIYKASRIHTLHTTHRYTHAFTYVTFPLSAQACCCYLCLGWKL